MREESVVGVGCGLPCGLLEWTPSNLFDMNKLAEFAHRSVEGATVFFRLYEKSVPFLGIIRLQRGIL